MSVTLKNFYVTNGFSPGADFFVLGPGSIARSGQFAALLTAMANDDGPIVRELVIVLPPGTTDLEVGQPIGDAFRLQRVELFGNASSGPGEVGLPFRVRFEASSSFDSSALVALVARARHPATFVVPQAARYRGTPATHDVPATPEDVWVPHLHELGVAMVDLVLPLDSYVVLDADEWWPHSEEHRALLLDVDDCGVAYVGDDSPTPADLIERWRDMAGRGDLEAALAEIDLRPDLKAAHRVFARTSAFNAANIPIEAIAEFTREKDAIDAEGGDGALILVQPAMEAGLRDLASALLTRSIQGLSRPETIQVALRHADELGDAPLIDRVETLLAERHPRSPLLPERAARRLVAQGRRLEAAAALEATGIGFLAHEAAYLRWLDAGLVADPIEPADLLASCRVTFPGEVPRTVRAVAEALERAGQRAEALDLLLAGPGEDGTLDTAGIRAALATLRRGILTLDPECDNEMAVAVVGAAVRWLSQNPLDGTTRMEVAELLSPQMMGGLTSTAVIALVCLDLSGRRLRRRASVPVAERPAACDHDLLPAILETGLDHLVRHPGQVLGRARFPAEALPVPADEAVAAIIVMLGHAGAAYGDADDAHLIENLLLVGTSLAAIGGEPDADMTLLRAAGGRLALHGRAQRTRDLAEHALNVAGNDPHRIRLAWHCFADLYHRSGNMPEALLGHACTLAADDAADVDQVWQESHLGVRLFRDVGLHALLPRFLAQARAALGDAGLAEKRAYWLDAIDLQVKLTGLDRSSADPVAFGTLLRDATASLRQALAEGDDPAPATMLLGSAARIAREAGLQVLDDVETAIDEGRSRLGPSARTLLSITADPTPDPRDLAQLASWLERARHPDDVGFDLRHLVLGAKRLLDSAPTDPMTVAFAIELLADIGLPVAGGARAADPPTDVATPSHDAREVAAGGIDVVMLGLSGASLIRATFAGTDEEVVVEDADTFSGEALREWRQRYPYAYQDPRRDTSHDFYVSTRHLGVSHLPERAVIVAETELQAFPPNILQVDDALAGQTRRLAFAPSLAWLREARRNPFDGAGGARAWIPHAEPTLGLPALAILASRLQPCLDAHGVLLHDGEETPSELSGSDLVIVGAHGGVGEGKRFFRVVLDDSDLALASSAVSGSIRNVGVVVLFVCSGGRIDKHPSASTTVGLAKQLLAGGCRAVVAPPWPLDTSVPPIWLPPFLEAWAAGSPVVDACFEANAAVRTARGPTPSADLAMTVYGDPLMRRPAPREKADRD